MVQITHVHAESNFEPLEAKLHHSPDFGVRSNHLPMCAVQATTVSFSYKSFTAWTILPVSSALLPVHCSQLTRACVVVMRTANLVSNTLHQGLREPATSGDTAV